MADDHHIIDLAAVRSARRAEPTCAFRSEEEALAPLRGALETLVNACITLDRYVPATTVNDWAGLLSDGFRHRMNRSGGAA